MVKKLFTSLFGIPFLAVGIGFGYFMVWPDAYDTYRAQDWVVIPVTLTHAKLVSSYSSDSTTWGVEATYHYSFDDKVFTSTRAAISEGNDNIGSFQQRLGRDLERAFKNGDTVYAWVNPANPSEAVLNRDLRWGLFALKAVFAVIFTLVGLAIMIGMWLHKSKSRKKESVARETNANSSTIDNRWKTDPHWRKSPIFSGVKMRLWVSWLFSIIWLALTSPATMAIPKELARGNYGILVILIFIIIGLGGLLYAIKETWAYLRFGPAPLTLDPHPGNMGGNVGGEIALNLPYDPKHEAIIKLTNFHTHETGSGKSRSTHNKILWQSEQKAIMEPQRSGSIAKFLFNTTGENTRPSEKKSRSYHRWEVSIDIDIPGPDIRRSYEIPVFHTGEEARSLSLSDFEDRALITDQHARLFLNAQREGMNHHITFPKKRAVFVQIPLIIAGLTACTIMSGYVVPIPEISTIPTIIIWTTGILCTWISGYFLGRRMEVFIQRNNIERRTSMFGIPTGHTIISKHTIQKIYQKQTSSSQQGNEQKSHHGIYIDHTEGKTVCIGYGIPGADLAEHTANEFKRLADID